MSETSTTTAVASQYAARVTDDLEHNAKEQERIGAEIATLQEKLTTLRRDHRVLLNIRQALADSASAPATEDATVPAARENTADSPAGRRQRARKPSVKKTTGAKSTAKKKEGPTLVELVRRHLGEESEPRSVTEVAAALSQAHPDRSIRATVVRNTLEGLVARQWAQRTKQGASVYYIVADSTEPGTTTEPSAQAETADHL
ncbi:hypothetical protein ACH4GE_36105 [Streptomyces tendae]|uniref:hypothetical protein n=1 Tax=Streptomyces tendae TaxID=1932 RepID=UPI0037ACFE99